MANTFHINPIQNPLGLGKVIVTSPGTPVPITFNLRALQANPSYSSGDVIDLNANKISIQAGVKSGANVDNVGVIYIGYAGMVKSTLVGVIKILNPGEEWDIADSKYANFFKVDDFYIDADNASDWALCSCHVN